MAKQRRKKKLTVFFKRLKKWRPLRFFVYRGKLRRGRFIITVVLVLGLASYLSDIKVNPASQATNTTTSLALNKLTREQFIQRLAPEAQSIQQRYHLRASISIAQAALESDWGRSELAFRYNNFFGVKAAAGMRSVTLPTKEYVNGQWITVDANFRVYDDFQASMVDHAILLTNGTTDKPQRYQTVIYADSVETAVAGLVSGGYATDPDYAKKLLNIIAVYKLEQYDK